MSLFESEYELKVSFEDLDPMSVVWHGNYIRYMERARCDMLSKLNYTYVDMQKDGYAYPVAKMNIKYIQSATFDDVLTVKTEVMSIEPALELKYKIYNKKTDEKIFEATTMQICVDMKTKESVYTAPKRLLEAAEKVCNEKN